MDTQTASGAAALSSSLQLQSLGADVISKTLGKVSEAGGLAAAGGIDIDSQKAILSAAYADMGKGTRVDTIA